MIKEELTEAEAAALRDMQSEVPELVEEQPQEAVAEAPAAPEPEAKAEPDPVKPPDGFVPHQALHQERERRKQAERERAEMLARLESLEKRIPEPAKAPEPEIPDPVVDPDGFRAWQRAELAKRDEAINAFQRQQEEQTAMRRRIDEAAALEAEFRKATPDYDDAAVFLRDNRVRELEMMGFQGQQIAQVLAQDANTIFDNARQSGKNPAEILYGMAKMRGYAGRQPEPVAQPSVSDAARIMAQAKAQAQTATLGTVAGAPTATAYTIEMLAKMSEEELRKVPEAEKRRVLGG